MPQVLPRLNSALQRLTLRQRILLLFLGLAGGSLLALSLALYYSYVKHGSPWSMDALLTAGVLSGCTIVLLVIGLWRLFDENVAKPLERMAGELRSRVHHPIAADFEDLQARHLGDLAPAAAALVRHLNQARNELAETVARETSRQVLEKEKYLALLAELPVAMVVCNSHHELVLYNEAARTLLAGNPVCLGRSLFEYLDQTHILAAYQKLNLNGKNRATQTLRCLIRPTGTPCEARMRLLAEPLAPTGHDNPAYVLTFPPPAELGSDPYYPGSGSDPNCRKWGSDPHSFSSARGLVFDFELLDYPRRTRLESLPWAAQTFVVFDTETTGLLPERGDEIVQLAAVRIVNGRRVAGEVYNTLVNPGRPIPAASTRIHGITDSMVAQAPSIEHVARQFHAFAKGAILVAHNADFDMAFLRRVEARIGLRFQQPVLDTAQLSAVVFGAAENHSLDALAARLEVELPDHARHTALGDATATAEILLKLLPALQTRDLPKR